MSNFFSAIKSFFTPRQEAVSDGENYRRKRLHIQNLIKDGVQTGDEVIVAFSDMEKRYGSDLPRRINLENQEQQSGIIKGTVTGKKLITGPTDCWMLEVSRIRVDPAGNKRMKSVVFLEDEITDMFVNDTTNNG